MKFRAPILVMLLLAFFALADPGSLSATEQYAAQTGWDCAVCHANPLGGGELTKLGEAYKAQLESSGGYKPLSAAKKAVRLVVGYLHILAGVVWFGAIFYVHILLKPAYASKGLPRGELILGWVSIAVVGVTGALLTLARMPSLHAFYDTRFGVLLTIKIALFLVMAGSAALVTFVLGPRMRRRREAALNAGGVYSAHELKAFDGREGRRAFVAVEGVIYDLTDSRLWKAGKHTRHLAGDDLTDALRQAPHGPDKLAAFPVAGRLAADSARAPSDRPRAVFYVMAYMNLIMVFLVLAVVALWRWW